MYAKYFILIFLLSSYLFSSDFNDISKKESWINIKKQAITLHSPIYFAEAKFLANKYYFYDTYIYRGKYNFTVCIVNIDNKNIDNALNSIKKSIPTAKKTPTNLIKYFEKQKFSTKGLFTKAKKKLVYIQHRKKKKEKKESKIFLYAKQEFNKKKYKKAIVFFTDFLNNNPKHIEANFLLGRSYYLLKQFEFALTTYQKILMINENLPRVKLELAQTYFALNMKKEALEEFNKVLISNAPKSVQNNIKRRIAFIEKQQQKHKFNYMLAVRYSSDNNINNTSSSKSYELYAPLFNSNLTLYNDPIQSDKSKTFLFGINHNYNIKNNLSIQTNFIKVSQKFNKFKDKNANTILLKSHLANTTQNDKISAGINFSTTKINNANYQKTLGIEATYKNKFSQNMIESYGFKIFQKKYHDIANKNKESNNLALTLGQTRTTKKYGNINIMGFANKEKKLRGVRTDVDNDEYGIVLSDFYKWNNFLSSTISLSSIRKKYKLIDVNFLTKRYDSIKSYSLFLNYIITKNLSTSFNIANTKTQSNHSPFSYKKTTKGVGLMYTF